MEVLPGISDSGFRLVHRTASLVWGKTILQKGGDNVTAELGLDPAKKKITPGPLDGCRVGLKSQREIPR